MRLLDLLASAVGLVVLCPLFLAAALAVKATSPGPVFHRAQRVGRGGRPFRLYKFRSMVVGADRAGPRITTAGDSRVTPVGRLLRGTKLDELPQLINVLKGEMSLVGPRPEDPRYVAFYTPAQRRVLSVRPGITSLASIAYRDESSLLVGEEWERLYVERVLPRKLAIELEYLARRGLWTDLAIVFRTLAAVALPAQLAFAQSSPEATPHSTASPSPHGRGARGEVRNSSPAKEVLSMRYRLPTPQAVWRRVRLAAVDAVLVVVCFSLALPLRFVGAPPELYVESLRELLPAFIFFFLACNYLFGNYHRIWRYASATEVTSIAFAAVSGTVLSLTYDTLLGAAPHVPLSTVGFGGFFTLVAFTGVRYRRRLFRGGLARLRTLRGSGCPVAGRVRRTRVLIVGAGDGGQLLAWRFLNMGPGKDYEVVGFVDDDPAKQGMMVHGLRVLGNRRAILEVVNRRQVDMIVIAIHNIDGDNFRAILDLCEMTPAVIKILPDVFDLFQATTGLPAIRDVTTADLLGRKPVQVDRTACAGILEGKTVLVTGAAGSIGAELCRQVLSFSPRLLLMLDSNESALHDLATELAPTYATDAEEGRVVVPIVADVTNETKMWFVFHSHAPEVVFHAAAYKHVPLMELFPDEAVRVNVGGTRVVAEMAARYGAERFVLVSTDKAINPSSVMGATKRLAELLAVLGNRRDTVATRFTAVRFGNVLGSRGSVVPTFERQIDAGGPVTVTDKGMTRYFMSIPEACRLIIQAAALTEGEDIFMLDMGNRINIDGLARRLIRLRGLRPEVDIPILYTGVRPGEKMHEELLGEGEERLPTSHPKIFRLRTHGAIDRASVESQAESLLALLATEHDGVVTRRLHELMRLGSTLGPAKLPATKN